MLRLARPGRARLHVRRGARAGRRARRPVRAGGRARAERSPTRYNGAMDLEERTLEDTLETDLLGLRRPGRRADEIEAAREAGGPHALCTVHAAEELPAADVVGRDRASPTSGRTRRLLLKGSSRGKGSIVGACRGQRRLPTAAHLRRALAAWGLSSPERGRAPALPRSDWKPCGDAPERPVRDAARAARLRPAARRRVRLFVARSPAPTRHTHRLAVLQLRRAGRVGGRLPRGRRRRPASRRLNERFDIVGIDPRGDRPERRRRSTARSTRRREGIYSQPFTTPFNLDVGALLIAKDRRYIRRCIERNDGDPRPRLDGQRGARHGPRSARRSASASSTTSASRTARSSARRTRACSRASYRAMVLDGADRRRRRTSTTRCRACASRRRLRARARPLLPGLRAPTRRRARASAATTRGTRTTSSSTRPTRTPIPAAGYTPTRARSTATTSAPPPVRRCTPSSSGPMLAPGARDGAGRRRLADPRSWSTTICYGRNPTTARTTRAPTATSRSARPSSATRPRRRLYLEAGEDPGSSSTTPTGTTATWSSTTGSGRSATGRVRGPVPGRRTRRRRRSWSPPPTTRRRRTAARCGSSATSATRGC